MNKIVQRLSELDGAYRGSPIVEGAGERYFDNSLRGGEGIRSRFILVFDSDADPSAREAARQLAESFAPIVELRLRPGHDLTLVRPDGYIAYSTHSRDSLAAWTSVTLASRASNRCGTTSEAAPSASRGRIMSGPYTFQPRRRASRSRARSDRVRRNGNESAQ
jgi:hypothetical protein